MYHCNQSSENKCLPIMADKKAKDKVHTLIPVQIIKMKYIPMKVNSIINMVNVYSSTQPNFLPLIARSFLSFRFTFQMVQYSSKSKIFFTKTFENSNIRKFEHSNRHFRKIRKFEKRNHCNVFHRSRKPAKHFRASFLTVLCILDIYLWLATNYFPYNQHTTSDSPPDKIKKGIRNGSGDIRMFLWFKSKSLILLSKKRALLINGLTNLFQLCPLIRELTEFLRNLIRIILSIIKWNATKY